MSSAPTRRCSAALALLATLGLLTFGCTSLHKRTNYKFDQPIAPDDPIPGIDRPEG